MRVQLKCQISASDINSKNLIYGWYHHFGKKWKCIYSHFQLCAELYVPTFPSVLTDLNYAKVRVEEIYVAKIEKKKKKNVN